MADTRGGERLLIVDGERWRVYEHIAAPDRRGVRTLVFATDHVMRRVRNYPPSWRQLDDKALLELGWSV